MRQKIFKVAVVFSFALLCRRLLSSILAWHLHLGEACSTEYRAGKSALAVIDSNTMLYLYQPISVPLLFAPYVSASLPQDASPQWSGSKQTLKLVGTFYPFDALGTDGGE